ncbi:S9 family peptidase [Hahella sp. CCB-MM4]|uniref:alpha/beta hydrolase family protein n=1 Tax=Hahella sp. (strain CCB-MM4) TaxID=1926491 RepID=UPI00143D5AC2|nr:alpha/beta fold hydrolase [Hahella sp. CCB-MM4]
MRTYHSPRQSTHPRLMVVLHGDAPFHPPDYHYQLAEILASNSDNLIAVGMLRPGYSDPDGRTSDGAKGDAIGDNYDAPRVRQIAEAIEQLRDKYQPSNVILVGHSGGAAITGNLIATYPDLVDEAVLVSCPCNINQWRTDMFQLTGKSFFKGDLDVISPVDQVNDVSTNTHITLITGKEDPVARPTLSHEYFEALQKADKSAELITVDGGHEIFLSPPVIRQLLHITNEKQSELR